MLINLSTATTVNQDVDETIRDLFQYHPWNDEQQEKGKKVREALEAAYRVIVETVQPSPTRTVALRNLVDCRMSANMAITFPGKF